MSALTRTQATPALTLSEDGHAVTTSLVVASHFGKRHADVLRAIETLGCSPEFAERNFAFSTYTVAGGKKSRREEPMCTITRDGFTLLAMGFTGPEAMRWKEAYIAAFNAMEARLHGLFMPPETEDRELHRKVSPRLWPILHTQSRALLLQVKTETDQDLRRNAYWALYRVNMSLGIPVPSMQALDVQPALTLASGREGGAA